MQFQALSRDERGSIASVAGFAFLVLLLIGSLVFGIWAFTSRQDYKDNSDKKSAEAVEAAVATQKELDEKDFTEREKQPYETFSGPSEFGSLKVVYPKTWELYVDIKPPTAGGNQIDGYGHPGYVPGVTSNTAFALRFQIVSSEYSAVVKQMEAQVTSGNAKASPFRATLVQSVLGVRLDGKYEPQKSGSMVILPLRDKTLKIWTESDVYVGDFNEILKNLSFSP